MTDLAPIGAARDPIKASRYDAAASLRLEAIPDRPVQFHRKAYTGPAHCFAQRWAESLGYFHAAANGSEVPGDWFNGSMAQVKVGVIEGSHSTCSRGGCFTSSRIAMSRTRASRAPRDAGTPGSRRHDARLLPGAGDDPGGLTALLDRVAAGVDQEGKAYCEEMKTRWASPTTAD